MKKISLLFLALVAVGLLSTASIAQQGGNPGPNPELGLLLSSPPCKAELESKMSAADVATLEQDLATLTQLNTQIQSIEQQIEVAARAGDRATVMTLQAQLGPLMDQQRATNTAINTLVASYGPLAGQVFVDCTKGNGGHDTTDHGGRDTSNHGGKDTTNNGGRDSTDHGGRDSLEHHGRGGNPGDHFRVDLGLLLRSDSCKLDLESKMSSADAAALEADLAGLKSLGDQMKALLQQMRDARKAKDTATFHALVTQLRSLLAQQRAATQALNTLLANYTTVINQVWVDCHKGGRPGPGRRGGTTGDSTAFHLEVKPIFPNPILSNSRTTQASLTYSLSADADVNILLSDTQGTTIQQVALDHEAAGVHTATINVAGLKAGSYFVRIQAGTVVQTQKLVVM